MRLFRFFVFPSHPLCYAWDRCCRFPVLIVAHLIRLPETQRNWNQLVFYVHKYLLQIKIWAQDECAFAVEKRFSESFFECGVTNIANHICAICELRSAITHFVITRQRARLLELRATARNTHLPNSNQTTTSSVSSAKAFPSTDNCTAQISSARPTAKPTLSTQLANFARFTVVMSDPTQSTTDTVSLAFPDSSLKKPPLESTKQKNALLSISFATSFQTQTSLPIGQFPGLYPSAAQTYLQIAVTLFWLLRLTSTNIRRTTQLARSRASTISSKTPNSSLCESSASILTPTPKTESKYEAPLKADFQLWNRKLGVLSQNLHLTNPLTPHCCSSTNNIWSHFFSAKSY